MYVFMMKPTTALLYLCFWLNTGICASPSGSKCGVPQVRSRLVHALRVVGGADATHGSHPWLVSLRKKSSHFCGGAILTDRWIMTAAHCFSSLSKEFLSGVRVVIGEFDQKVVDEEEQVFLIKNISVHEKYRHVLPMNYDIALLELNQRIQFGKRVQPVCLPLPDDNTRPNTDCIVGGWGRTKERGRLSTTLREVLLTLVDPAKCKYVLQTVKSAIVSRTLNQPQPALTVLCAGPETGGRDTCQGDSGGPLVCPAGSVGGHWVARGVTSWGKGCGRSWESNSSRPPSRRGSPGVFTDVKLLLPWIKETLRQAEAKQSGRILTRLCSVQDGAVTDSEGVLRNPALHHGYYDNNELCVWSISVPPGYSILLEFEHLALENDSYCLFDRLTVSVGPRKPVGVFCGSVYPSQVFLKNSHHATVLFSSDISVVGSGFVMRHRAVQRLADLVCGTVVLVQNETSIHSPNYPQHYSNDCVFRWVVYASQGHVIKLNLTDFELEESSRCLYDSLRVFGDVEGTEEMAVLCGGSIPPPVISYHNVMVLHFTSDGSTTHKGFSASFDFISQSELHHEGQPCVHCPRVNVRRSHTKDLTENRPHTESHVTSGSADLVGLQSGRRVLYQDDMDLSSAEHIMPKNSDDEEYTDESSGTA